MFIQDLVLATELFDGYSSNNLVQECFSGCSQASLTFVKNSLVTVIHELRAQLNLYLYSPHVLPIHLKRSTDLHIMPSNHHESSENRWVDDLFMCRWKGKTFIYFLYFSSNL